MNRPLRSTSEIEEFIFSHIAKTLRESDLTEVLIAVAIPKHPTFFQAIGALAQIQLERIEVWNMALDWVIRECTMKGGLNQTL